MERNARALGDRTSATPSKTIRDERPITAIRDSPSRPASDWFLDYFQEQFGQMPDYIAAGSFVMGLVLTECIQRASSLDDEKLRSTTSELDFNTFYGRFRIDPRSAMQTGHRTLLIRWQGGEKIVLPSP
jgi:ABC-type branched-subunit amino acid transport system substrate-binding protein